MSRELITFEERQKLLDASPADVVAFMTKHFNIPVQLDVVIPVIESGKLSSCEFGGGTPSLGKRAFCQAVFAIITTALAAATLGTVGFGFMILDKYMLCQTTMQYASSIFWKITTQHDTCGMYAERAQLIKTCVTSTLSGVTLTNWKSNLNKIKCAIRKLDKECECDMDDSNTKQVTVAKSRLLRGSR